MNSNFYRFVSARFLSTLSTQMQLVAIGWQVYEITKNPMSLGLIGLAQFLPMFCFSLISGQVADRHDRRSIISISIFVMFLCSTSLFWVTKEKIPSAYLIYLILIFMGTTRSFWGAASQSYLPHLISRENFPRAAAFNSSCWQVANITGPAIGGLIYSWSGNASTVYVGSALLMLTSFFLINTIKIRTGQLEKEPINRKTLLAGIQYIWNEKNILGATSLDLFAVLLGGAVALLPVYASDILKVGPSGLGFLRSAPAVGAVIMGITLTFRPLSRNAGLKMFLCVMGFGIATIIFGISKSFFLSLAALCIMGALDQVSIVIRHSLVQLTTPPHMRGRVSSINMLFISASNELGEFESGLTAAWFGVVPAVIIGGVGTCLVTFIWSYFFPELRKLDYLSPKILSQSHISNTDSPDNGEKKDDPARPLAIQ